MSKEELHQIEELPDLKVNWIESYKYHCTCHIRQQICGKKLIR